MLADEERPYLNEDQLALLEKDELIKHFKQLQKYTDNLQLKYQQSDKVKSFEIAKLKNLILMKYVSSKEQESTVIIIEFFRSYTLSLIYFFC